MTKPHLLGVLAGLFLAAGLVLAAMLVTRAWLRISESQTVSVTGSARKAVRSDLVVWRGSFTADGDTLLAAQRNLKAGLSRVENFVRAAGMTNSRSRRSTRPRPARKGSTTRPRWKRRSRPW